MATKKAAKKAVGKSKAKAFKSTGVTLPEGFRSITTGDYGDPWEYEDKPLLQGVVQGDVREVESGSGRNKHVSRVITVLDAEDGRSYTVWESASLRGFFDLVQKGFSVAIAYHGERDVGKPQPMKVFDGAISEDDLAALEEAPPARKKAAKKSKKSSSDF